jgi:hypothetical protein
MKMPELNNPNILTVTEDYAMDKEIPLEDEIIVEEPVEQLEEVKPTPKDTDEIAIVNLDEPFPGFKPLHQPREDNADDMGSVEVIEETEPAEITGLCDKWDAKEFGADQIPDEKIVVEEVVPGSDIKFEEDKAEDKPEVQTDWAKDGDHSKFIAYIIERKNNIPKHSGETVVGCERALHYLKSLDLEISKAMRTDLKGLIDEQQIDSIRKEIEVMSERLNKQITKLQGKKRKADLEVRIISQGQCDKCSCETPMWHNVAESKMVCLSCNNEIDVEGECSECDKGIVAEAQTPRLNIYVSAFERAIFGTLIDSAVSGGHNINETYEKLKKKYELTPREELAIQQLVADAGYAMYWDRGRVGDKEQDVSDGNGIDFATNYHA